MTTSPQQVTKLLVDWSNGNQSALEQLTPLVYGELRRLAGRYLRKERPDHTLQSTAFVHEAYIRLIDQRNVRWQNRAHFFGVAAQMIRRILVDHARDRHASKRGSGAPNLSLDEAIALPERKDLDLVALDDALNSLAKIDPQQARIVELRFFTGLTVEETAEVLGISPATVKRDWVTAKAWLYRDISRAHRQSALIGGGGEKKFSTPLSTSIHRERAAYLDETCAEDEEHYVRKSLSCLHRMTTQATSFFGVPRLNLRPGGSGSTRSAGRPTRRIVRDRGRGGPWRHGICLQGGTVTTTRNSTASR